MSQHPVRVAVAIVSATAALEFFIRVIAPAINVPVNPVGILTAINAALFGGSPAQYMVISSIEHWVWRSSPEFLYHDRQTDLS